MLKKNSKTTEAELPQGGQTYDPGESQVDHGTTVEHNEPVKESEATAVEPTKTVPAGSADPTADATADGRHNDTVNTHPQSPLHQGNLSDADKKKMVDEFNQPGAQVLAIAEKFGVTSERVFQVVDEANGVPEDER